MAINPFISLFGTGAGAALPAGAGGLGAGAAGAAAAGGGMPWSILLPIIASLIPSLLGGSEEDKQEQEMIKLQQTLRQLGINKPYQSPYAKQLDPIVMQAILNNFQRSANWGWPAGKQMDLSFLEDFAIGPMGGRIRQGSIGG